MTITELRKKHNYSVQDLARILGISPSYLTHIEKGRRNLSKDKLAVLCQLFKIELELLTLPEALEDRNEIIEFLKVHTDILKTVRGIIIQRKK